MTQEPERREDLVELGADAIRVRAGLSAAAGVLLAGGPVQLEFVVESYGSHPLYLAVGGDRAGHRPGQFCFTAGFEGVPLADPAAGNPSMGGPFGTVLLTAGKPWRQPLLLNQFVRLEDTQARLVAGATGRLDLLCRRSLPLARDEAAAMMPRGAFVAEFHLWFNLYRDDDALAKLAVKYWSKHCAGQCPSAKGH